MKNFLRIALSAICTLLFVNITTAQVILTEQQAEELGFSYLEINFPNYGLVDSDIESIRVLNNYHDPHTGMHHLYLQQEFEGTIVEQSKAGIHFNQNGLIFHTSVRFVPSLADKVNDEVEPFDPDRAVEYAGDHLGIILPEVTPTPGTGNQTGKMVFNTTPVTLEPITTELVYFKVSDSSVRKSYSVEVYLADATAYYDLIIDAESGEVLDESNLVISCEFDLGTGHKSCNHKFHGIEDKGHAALVAPNDYNVFAIPAESPNHGPQIVVNSPWDLTASPYGWHDTNGSAGAEFTITRGNNVHAYQDSNASNSSSGDEPDGGATLDFNFPYSYPAPPVDNQDAAVTNLFYGNNIVHDIAYLFGFNEVNGNFQVNNYGNGGVSGDDVRAEAMDGGGLNNANFFTPSDGSRPRMQMYLWSTASPYLDGDFDNGIVFHEYAHGVSNRLTGGPFSVGCLNNQEQMGEGWSDYFSLILTMESGDLGPDGRGIGTFALDQSTSGPGIRPARYSTDLSVNDYTYGDIASGSLSVPHGVGFVWATMLWEMTWGLIDQHGFDEDLYNNPNSGNAIALQLIMEGMKLQPCSPGFVDGRDAILAADMALYGGANQCIIWEAFAKRGLGLNASQGSSSSIYDGTEDFDDNSTACGATADANLFALYPWGQNNNISSYAYDADTDAISLINNPHASTGVENNYALAVNPVNNNVYLLADSDNTGERALFSYDIVSGNILAELGDVVSVNGNNKPNVMEFDQWGNLYVAFKNGELNILDISTMTASSFSAVPTGGAAGLAYDSDNARLIYAAGDDPSINLTAICILSGDTESLFSFEIDPGCCTAQGIEYVSPNKLISAGTYGGNTIYTVDLDAQTSTTLLNPSESFSSIKSLMFYPPYIPDCNLVCKDVTIELDDTGNASIAVSDLAVVVGQGCEPAELLIDVSTFDCTDVGQNPVQITETLGNYASCSVTVTVIETESPISECQDIAVNLNPDGTICISSQDIDGGSSDNCGIETQEIGILSGDAASETIYFTGTKDGYIWSAPADGSGTPAVVYDGSDGVPGSGPVGIEINTDTETLYFGGGNSSDIFEAPLDGSGPITEVPGTSECCERHDFEMDWVNNRVFYTTDNNGMYVVNLDGTGLTNIVSSIDVISVTYDRTNDKLYFVNQDSWDIASSDTDGDNLITNLYAASQPRGITMDESTGTLFWIEKNELAVYTAPADGSGTPQLLYSSGVGSNAYGIDYVQQTNTLYWTVFSGSQDYVLSAPADGSGTPTIVYQGDFGSIRGIAAGRNIDAGGGSIEYTTDCIEFTCDDIGDHEVYLSNTDAAGNSSNCNAIVTILESIPNAICSDVTIELDESGLGALSAAEIDGGSYDACSSEVSLSIEAQDENWDCSAVGVNDVVLTVTNDSGVEATCTAAVTVEDNLAPLLNCVDLVINLDPGLCGQVIQYNIDATDNCGIDAETLISGPASETYLDYHDGPWTVEYEVTDINGNTTNCSFSVTMNEYANPTEALACNDLVVVAIDEDGCSIVGADMILEGGPYGCYDDYIVDIDFDGNEVCCSAIGSILTAVVTDPDTGNTCTGSIQPIDAIAPYCSSVTDYTIDCTETIPSSDDTSHPAYPQFYDNCGIESISLVSETTSDSDICTNGGITIEREWTAMDIHGNPASSNCVQTITIERAPLTLPADGEYDCALYELDDLMPALTGEPAGVADGCMYNYAFADVVLPSCGSTSKISRTWTILDMCTDEIITHVQIIKLTDTEGPSIDASGMTLNTDSDQCAFTGFIGAPSISDNCSEITSVQMFIEGLTELSYVYDGSGNLVGGYVEGAGMELGTYTLSITATDACGNISTAEVDVTIVDDITPTAICDEITQVALESNGTAEVFAETFDDGSHDNCCLEGFDVRRMDGAEFGATVSFDCADIGATTQVILRVHDCHGNTNSCMVEVLVEDKIAPYLAVPAGTEISCEDYFANIAAELDNGNGAILDDMFGVATFGDNCEAILDYSYTYGVDQCGEGSITRSWTVNDPSDNGPVSGTQTITIYHVSDWSISFPGDLDASCVDGELPDFGQPLVSGDDCEMIAVSHTDTQYDVVPDACYKIVREWSAINWCTYPDEAAVTATQVIKVTDDEAPIFDVEDFTVEITEADCDVAVTLPTPDVTDCSDDITIETSSDLPAGEAGPGTYTATYTVSDGCGNFSYDVITITVVDGKDPTPYVTDHLVTEIMQTGMTQLINVNDYNIGSFDNCSDVVLSFSPDVTDTEVQFTCDDIGENTLEIWVTDEAGNQDFVTVTMEVQDNMEACGPGSLTVAGALHTSDEQGIEDATVDINGGLFTQVTDETGTFGFDLETGGDYSVVPSLDLNASNGVTTFDIVLITQHILGINPFDSPYQLIAADANKSNSITTLDVVAIRMVILQMTDAFPNNTSWRFVDKSHVFADPMNPWGFPEVVNINNLDEEMLDVDFTGIKIGDVNGSAQANFMSPAENRTSDAIHIDAVDKLVQAGKEVTVSFTTEAAVSGYQFTLNHRDLELVSVNDGLAKAEHFGIHSGAITASWNDMDIRNLRGEELFSVTFKALADLQLSEALTINSRYTQAEAYTTQGIEGVELTFTGQSSANYVLYQSVPNPSKGHAVIGFDLAKAGQASLSIMTLDGKLVKSISGTFEAGYNEFVIKDLKAAGVLYYSLESGDFTATKKMILIK